MKLNRLTSYTRQLFMMMIRYEGESQLTSCMKLLFMKTLMIRYAIESQLTSCMILLFMNGFTIAITLSMKLTVLMTWMALSRTGWQSCE